MKFARWVFLIAGIYGFKRKSTGGSSGTIPATGVGRRQHLVPDEFDDFRRRERALGCANLDDEACEPGEILSLLPANAVEFRRMTADSHDPVSAPHPAKDLNKIKDQLPPDLAYLCKSEIEPVLIRYFSGKLRSSLRDSDDSQVNQDALELVSEAKVRILRKLCNNAAGTGTEIAELEAYTRTVARNVFHQYLRSKYPRRLSVKNQCRYLLTHHRDLALWRGDNDLLLCGLKSNEPGSRPGVIALTLEIYDELRRKLRGDHGASSATDLIEAVIQILKHAGAPVAMDDLVTAVMELLQIQEIVEAPQTEELSNFPGSTSTSQNAIEEKEFVRVLWKEILLMPLRHRAALLLNFRDENGYDLASTIVTSGAASIREIAAALGMEAEQFAEIWRELPWDDRRIAAHLGLERQQVINLRQSAKQKLRRKLV